ncbi:MAG: phosphoheptose isomerase [Crocinitomicaceae bacterium]|nr:phosphoheptose isomerase [Crocinitomicaceae bacterium]|tara:strand:+ start:3345 stop:3914 length:570 start_codon:yes stop_codon:yes gene_type:complete
MDFIRSQFSEAQKILEEFSVEENFALIDLAANLMVQCLKNGGKIISCGNGGSMSDAMHFAEELSGRYRDDRPAMAALSISDAGHLTCVANDYGYDFVFSRFVEAVGNKGDILLGISTSGNSQNVINAISAAKEKGMRVICLTGKDGGKIAGTCDVEIRAPKSDYADRVQEIHIKVIHALIGRIEQGMAK